MTFLCSFALIVTSFSYAWTLENSSLNLFLSGWKHVIDNLDLPFLFLSPAAKRVHPYPTPSAILLQCLATRKVQKKCQEILSASAVSANLTEVSSFVYLSLTNYPRSVMGRDYCVRTAGREAWLALMVWCHRWSPEM
jgi:hypothetical protein